MAVAAFDLGPDWIKVADAADDPVTVQCRGDLGMEVIFADAVPDPADVGFAIGSFLAVTRSHGSGHIYVRELRGPNDRRDAGRAVVMT